MPFQDLFKFIDRDIIIFSNTPLDFQTRIAIFNKIKTFVEIAEQIIFDIN